MNRIKKHELAKYSAERVGLDPVQIQALDGQQADEQRLDQLTRQIHAEWFPEEYDFFYDSCAEANIRQQGLNLPDRQQPRHLGDDPMSASYMQAVNQRRQALGVAQLEPNGTYHGQDSWQVARREAVQRLLTLGDVGATVSTPSG